MMEGSRRRAHGWRMAIGFVSVVPMVWACKSAPAKKPAAAIPVRVAAATRIDAPVNVAASGMVEPMQSVAVTSKATGTLSEVLFHEGDFVREGQLLLRIDERPLQADVDQATANLARDQAQADASATDDARYSQLADIGYVSRSQSDQMHATAVAQGATVAADRAALRAAEVNLGFAEIRAPIAGRTGSLLVRQGNNVGPSSGPIVLINQISPVLVRFPVLQEEFAVLQRALAAHPLTASAVGSDSTATLEHGQLRFLDNAVDSSTGTVTGKASFDNGARRLWPGELVLVTVQVDIQRGVIAVPNEALLTGQQGSYVYVVDAKNTATTRPVTTGIQVDDMTVVKSGLAFGERVVVDGQSRLNPGSRVAIVTAGGDTAAAGLTGVGGGNVGSASGDVVTGAPGTANMPPTRNIGGGVGTTPAAPSTPGTPAGTPATPAGTPSGTPSGTRPPTTAPPGSTTPPATTGGGRGGGS